MKYLENLTWLLDSTRADELAIGVLLLPVLLLTGCDKYFAVCDKSRADEALFCLLSCAVVTAFAALLLFMLADQLPLLPVLMLAAWWLRRQAVAP